MDVMERRALSRSIFQASSKELKYGARTFDFSNGGIALTIGENILSEKAITSVNNIREKLAAGEITLPATFEQLFEKYPDLKANQNFMELQAQLEGTENRISVERKNFNDAVKDYNTGLRRFPTNIVANMFGFDKKAYFESAAGSEVAPKVEF